MKKVISILIAVAFLVTLSSAAFAACGGNMCGIKGASAGNIINDTCPVMGGKVDKDTPYKTTYKGKEIGFCCAGCVDAFKVDPEKYMGKVQKQQGGHAVTCPNCGVEIDI